MPLEIRSEITPLINENIKLSPNMENFLEEYEKGNIELR